jgi:hypothetical protein
MVDSADPVGFDDSRVFAQRLKEKRDHSTMAPLFRPLILLTALVSTCQLTVAAEGHAEGIPKMSQFAPAEDLISQVDFYLGRLEQSLASEDSFDLAAQSRTVKDANTLAVLALVLAVHDQQHALRGSAGLLAAAQRLAAAEGDYGRASAALKDLKAARAGGGGDGPAVSWQKSASLPALMKQVPLVHTSLKRGVDPSRLARQKTQSAGQAAVLAAIAQASMLDTEYAANAADLAEWRSYCTAMRDASGEVNSAVRAADSARVAESMKRLTQSCDACHAKFRHP